MTARQDSPKLKMHSPDLTQANIDKLAELFPNCITEAEDDSGQLKRAIDFDQLRQELSDHVVDGPRERYRLDWPGKREAQLAANAPIAKTLRPCREESVDFDTTQNLFIEGDNLDALKLLQENYLNSVKMIYIDPPYNTGNDFIYNDNFTEKSDDYLKRTNQSNEQGQLVANLETNGRFHSDWLSMMLPRLYLARNLLSEDGVIFISIDDGEVGNIRKCCDELFGQDNLIANIVWQKKYTRANDARWFSANHDHILCYAKNKTAMSLNLLPRNEEQLAAYKNPDNHPKGPWKATPLHAKSGTNTTSYTFQNGITWTPPKGTYRRYTDNTLKNLEENNEIWFGPDGIQTPSRKSFLSQIKSGVTPVTLWTYNEVGHNHEANTELKKLNLNGIFDNPKPTRLIKRMLLLATGEGDTVLDFFAGSSTTADAVMQLNAESNAKRQFIIVQYPELCDTTSEAFQTGYNQLAKFSTERIRRAGQKIKKDNADQEGIDDLDIGFRVVKVDSSNMKDVYYTPDQVSQQDLLGQVDNIKEDRSDEDLLFQVLLDWGVDLSLPITPASVAGKTVYFVDGNTLAACFETDINEVFIKALAGYKPRRAVFRDSGFDSDDTKINVEQIFKQLSPITKVKTL